MRAERQVTRCNRILAAELGSIDGTHAAFEWHWSEDLRAAAPAENAHGEPVYDMRCGCGKNVRVHEPNCALEIAIQRFEVMRLTPTVHNRWILCRWLAPPSVEHWKAAFGSTESYPFNGTYVPMSINEQPMALNRDVVPSEELTWKLVYAIKSQPSTRALLDQYLEGRNKRDAVAVMDEKGRIVSRPGPGSEWAKRRDQLRDQMTTFGQIPGTRDSHVSYPSVTKGNVN